MKKLLFLSILFILNVFLFSGIVFAENNLKVVIGSGYYNYSENNFVVNYDVFGENFGGNAIVFCAVYDANGNFLTCEFDNFSFDDKKIAHKRAVFPISEETLKNGSLKMLLWEGAENMKPLEKCVDVKISEIKNFGENVCFDFSRDEFTSLGKLEEEKTVSNVTFVTKSGGKELSVKSDGCVYFFGGGKVSDCALKFDVLGNCKINFYGKSVSSDESRYLKVNDGKNDLARFEIEPNCITTASYQYFGEEKSLYIFSEVKGLYIYQIEILYDYAPDVFGEFYVNDFSSLRSAIWKAEEAGGGKIVINADEIKCNSEILLMKENSNITICGGNGFSSVLNFEPYRSRLTDVSKIVDKKGIRITGSNYRLEDIVVENVPGRGINLSGKACGFNVFKNIVSRYNNGSGFATTSLAHDNVFENCYAYRNCDIYTIGGNADGFSISISCGDNNKLIDCYAWENSDDGFDSFAMYCDLVYENCFAWHNGDPDVYTGKYDFDRGRELDEKLYLIKIIENQDENFKQNYLNKKFELPQEEFIDVIDNSENSEGTKKISIEQFIGDEWRGNPNGFKLGSGNSKHGPQVTGEVCRIMKNCVAFDHIGKGFDRNSSTCTVQIENGIAFDNKMYNYQLDMCEVPVFINAFEYGGRNKLPESCLINKLSEKEFLNVKNKIYKRVDYIESVVCNNKIPLKYNNVDELFSVND